MKKIFSSFSLKIIAIITMTLDHIGYFLFPKIRILRIIGRISFPLFAYLTAEAMQFSKNKIKYISILLCCGLLFSLVASLITKSWVPNAFMDLGLGALCCFLLYKKNTFAHILILLILMSTMTEYSLTQYKIFGLIAILIFYDFYSNLKLSLITYSLWTILSIYLQNFMIFNMYLEEGYFLLLPIGLIYLHNGERGFYHPKWKYAFYAYYPLHIVLLFLIRGGI